MKIQVVEGTCNSCLFVLCGCKDMTRLLRLPSCNGTPLIYACRDLDVIARLEYLNRMRVLHARVQYSVKVYRHTLAREVR